MRKIWPIFKWFLIAWGGLCFLAALAFGCILTYGFISSNQSSTKTASKQDVRYVLNWCGLGDDRIEEVLHSYISARSFTGDHLDAHAIRISHIDISELTQKGTDRTWYRCNEVNGMMADTLDFVRGWLGDEIPWFPSYEELRSGDMYVYPWSIYLQGNKPTAVELIFVRPKDNMVFYFGCKM